MRRISYIFAFLLICFVVFFAFQHFRTGGVAARSDEIEIFDPYARISPTGAGAVFFTLRNGTGQSRSLIAAETSVAEKTELHTHREEEGVMKMVPIDQVMVAPGAQAHLKRGGDHVMMFGVDGAVSDGSSFEITLIFDDGSRKALEVIVDQDRKPGMEGAHSSH